MAVMIDLIVLDTATAQNVIDGQAKFDRMGLKHFGVNEVYKVVPSIFGAI